MTIGDEYTGPVSGRASSRGDYYSNYNYNGSRAISPHSVGYAPSPRLGYPSGGPYGLIDSAEGNTKKNKGLMKNWR